MDDIDNATFGVSRWLGIAALTLGIVTNTLRYPLQFQKIFVVGLPSRTDRRDGMLLQAALTDVDIEFIDGVLGKDVTENAIPRPKKDQKLASPGVIGSWRAHMNAIHE